jgi:hypothetical protein
MRFDDPTEQGKSNEIGKLIDRWIDRQCQSLHQHSEVCRLDEDKQREVLDFVLADIAAHAALHLSYDDMDRAEEVMIDGLLHARAIRSMNKRAETVEKTYTATLSDGSKVSAKAFTWQAAHDEIYGRCEDRGVYPISMQRDDQ